MAEIYNLAGRSRGLPTVSQIGIARQLHMNVRKKIWPPLTTAAVPLLHPFNDGQTINTSYAVELNRHAEIMLAEHDTVVERLYAHGRCPFQCHDQQERNDRDHYAGQTEIQPADPGCDHSLHSKWLDHGNRQAKNRHGVILDP